MSKFSLDKLKELKDQIAEPRKNPELNDGGSEFDDPYKTALERDSSPVKLLSTFSQLTPSSEPASTDPSEDSSSWLTNVKGKLAKTVDTSLEKYQEIKAERERAKMVSKGSETSLSLDLDEDSVTDQRRMSHSFSEVTLTENTKESVTVRPQSQIFEFDPLSETEKESSGSIVSDGSAAQDIPSKGGSSTDTPLSSTPNTETPTKARRRFANLFSRSSTSTTSTPAPVSCSPEKVETPRRSVRALLRDYVGKPSTPSETDVASSPIREMTLEDPFSGVDPILSSDAEVEKKVDDGGHETPEVEEGLDAAEMSITPEELSSEEVQSTIVTPERSFISPGHPLASAVPLPPPQMTPPPALPDLVSPVIVAILAVANFLLPLWISGFLTGLAIAGVTTYWVCCNLYPTVTASRPPVPTPADQIEIHEAPAVFSAWMNLLPPQFQPYDVDTYEVRNTVSVRVSVEHHMLKIEYPEWNLPKRLNTDEVIPEDLKFLYHSDHVDLTKARISLLPDGIAGKRMFSKKYPIEIRTNGLSVTQSQQPTSLLKHKKFSRSKESINSDDSEVFKDVVGTPSKHSPVSEFPENKVFCLFARADREKEDIYKCLTDAHHFLTDTVLDVARKEGAITEGIDSDAGGRQTVRERKTYFDDFMALVLGNHKRDNLSEEDPCLNFLNVFLNRIFYDIHKSEQIKTMLKTRVYNKLLKIKITQWFKSIELTEINMGRTLPRVCWVSNLHQDDRGLWVELGVEYDGIASATIETCGLIIGDEIPDSGTACVQLKALLETPDHGNAGINVQQPPEPGSRKVSSRIVAATNSDEEDSAEEDSDSQELDPVPVDQVVGGQQGVQEVNMSRARWWEVVGSSEIVKTGISKLSKSEWFKQKTSKKMTLQLEVTSLSGVMVLNIPPPPSDRVWYSFKTRPDLGLRIVPFYGGEKLGNDNTFSSRAINKIIDIVVNRLKEEIHKFVLLPNMDDIPIKIMDPFPTTNEVKI